MLSDSSFSRLWFVWILLGSAPSLHASTITAKFLGEVYSTPIMRSLDGGLSYSEQSVGIMHFQRISGNSPILATDFYTFCIEPQQGVSANNTYTYEFVADLKRAPTNVNNGSPNNPNGGMGAVKADYLRQLYGKFAPQFNSAMLDDVTARALQIASWVIVRETSTNFSLIAGTVRFSATSGNKLDSSEQVLATAAMNRATVMLNSLVSPNSYAEKPYYFALMSGSPTNAQDMVVFLTPEPVSIGLVGLGSLGLIARAASRHKS